MMKYLLIISTLLFTHTAFAQCPEVSEVVETLIQHHQNKVRGGEYCKYREVVKNSDIEVVLYTIEGACNDDIKSPKGSCGNHFNRYITGTVKGEVLTPIIIGGKGDFITKKAVISGESLIISGLSYAKGDPLCCPSEATNHEYVFEKGTFKRINL